MDSQPRDELFSVYDFAAGFLIRRLHEKEAKKVQNFTT